MNKKELAGQLISAVVYIALGLILALNPGMSANLICSGIGVCALVYGAFSILLYYMRRRDGDVSRFALPVGIACGPGRLLPDSAGGGAVYHPPALRRRAAH